MHFFFRQLIFFSSFSFVLQNQIRSRRLNVYTQGACVARSKEEKGNLHFFLLLLLLSLSRFPPSFFSFSSSILKLFFFSPSILCSLSFPELSSSPLTIKDISRPTILTNFSSSSSSNTVTHVQWQCYTNDRSGIVQREKKEGKRRKKKKKRGKKGKSAELRSLLVLTYLSG